MQKIAKRRNFFSTSPTLLDSLLETGRPRRLHGAQGHQPRHRLLLRLLRQQEAQLHRDGGPPQEQGHHGHLRLRHRLRRLRGCVSPSFYLLYSSECTYFFICVPFRLLTLLISETSGRGKLACVN